MADRDERVGEAVAWYYRAAEAGEVPDPAAFIARFPDLRADLESFLADKAAFDRAAGPLVAVRHVALSPGVGSLIRYRYWRHRGSGRARGFRIPPSAPAIGQARA